MASSSSVRKDGHRFAVVSNGRTASYWLAAALDAHPEISCGHSKQVPMIPDYRGSGLGKTLDTAIGEADTLPTEPGAYYDLLEQFGDGPYYGTVHAFDVGAAESLRDAGIQAALLTRHPIVRLDSFADRRKIEMEQSKLVFDRVRAGVCANLDRFPAGRNALNDANAVDWVPFVSACFDVAYEVLQLGKYPYVLQSERITTDPDYLSWFLYSFLNLTTTTGYLDDVFSFGKLNTLSKRRTTAQSIFSGWPDWKRETFEIFNQSYQISRFSDYGYNVDGVIKASRNANGTGLRTNSASFPDLGENGYVVCNLDTTNPPSWRSGTEVRIFVALCSETKISVSVGDRLNNTDMLHRHMPVGTRVAMIAFNAPEEPGTYPLKVTAIAQDGAPRNVIDTFVEVRNADVALADDGLLRMTIEPVA